MVNNTNGAAETAFAELLRDLARCAPPAGYDASSLKLTVTQAAIVVRVKPDVVAEALAGLEGDIASAMVCSRHKRADLVNGALCESLYSAITAKCASYILEDVQHACEWLADGRRVDARFERQVSA